MTAERQGPSGRPWLIGGAGALVLALLAAAGIWWVGGQQEDRIYSSALQLPNSAITLTAVVAGRTHGEQRIELSWSAQQGTQDPQLNPTVGADTGPSRLRVTVGGRAEAVGSETLSTKDSARFTMPGPARSVLVAARYAGRWQQIDLVTGRRDVGAFAGLYRDRRAVLRQAEGWTRGQSTGPLDWESQVEVTYARVPYLPDLGWVRRGQDWLVILEGGLRVGMMSREGTGTYAPKPRQPYTVAAENGRSARPAEQHRTNPEPDRLNLRGAVLAVPASAPTALHITYRGKADSRQAEDEPTLPFRASGSVPIDAGSAS